MLDLLLRGRREVDAIGAIHLLRNGLDFLGDTALVAIGELERLSTAAFIVAVFAQAHNLASQLFAAFATLGPHFGKSNVHAEFLAPGLDQVELGFRIGRECVDSNHTGKLVHRGDVFHVLQQVRKTRLKRLEVFFIQLGLRHAAVVLERANSRDNHNCIGLQIRQAALDVEEFLGTKIGTETGFRNGVIAQRHGHARSDDRIAAVGDVREGTAVNECRRTLKRLHKVRLQRVFQECAHGTLSIQLASGDGLVGTRVANDNAGQALFEVGNARSQAENSHDFGSDGDIKTVLTGHARSLSAHAAHDMAQLAIVHVDHALPCDATHVEPERVALVNVVVDHGGKQIVRSTNGMEVAREVQIDVLHGNDLGVSAASGAALNAEYGTERRLAQRDQSVFANATHGVGQTDRSGRFAFARRRRVNGRNQYELAGSMSFVGKQVVVDLRLVVAVLFEILLGHASTLGDHGDFLGGCSLGNFNVSQHVGPFLPAAFSYRNEVHCNDGGARKVPRHELGADSQGNGTRPLRASRKLGRKERSEAHGLDRTHASNEIN